MSATASRWIAATLSISACAGFVPPTSSFGKGGLSTKHVPSSPLAAASASGAVDDVTMDDAPPPPSSMSMASSLASSYAIRIHPSTLIDDGCHELRWDLHPLGRWEEPHQGEGTLALRALDNCAQLATGGDDGASCTISCRWYPSDAPSDADADAWCINVAVASEGENIVPRELLCVLSRIMVQSAASQIATDAEERGALLRATLPLMEGEGCQKLLLSDLLTGEQEDDASDQRCGVRHLFDPLNPHHAAMELVDMVDHEGRVLGSLPRPYVHTWNILHRGIGMIVSKDDDILRGLQSGSVPDVYVHQRTATKRIFPSLYDMFVGGVSASGEDSRLTAAREVAEELGLDGALNALQSEKDETKTTNPLSEELFRCTICTSCNRCVVSMFTYTCDTASENIAWQEEEVAWGEFVPYPIVELAGDMSIDRLMERGDFPGSTVTSKNEEELTLAIEDLKRKYDIDQPWDAWDFVPDGLLVWEAWKAFIRREHFV